MTEESERTQHQATRNSRLITDDQRKSDANETSKHMTSSDPKKPVLVLINPHSGRGQSVSIYKKKLIPFLKSHDIEHQVFITESESRVYDYIHSRSLSDLTSLKSIIVVSGDGLFHETINALMARSDWEQAITVPIGLVPTGSGNGLAYTLIKQRHNNLKDVDEAIKVCCEQAIQERTSEADLVKVSIGSKTTIWSFLSIGWGLLADIDIDSEWLRCLGEFRFTLYGLLRSVTSVSYKGRLSFQVASNSATSLQYKLNLNEESNSTDKMYDTSSTSILDENQDTNKWVHIEDTFACLYAVYQSHVSSVTNFAPQSTLTDQLIYLTYIRGKLSLIRVVEFLLAIKDGSHEKLPYVKVVPVNKFRFQPLDSSKIVIDGEKISWNLADGPIDAVVVPKVMKLAWTPQPESN